MTNKQSRKCNWIGSEFCKKLNEEYSANINEDETMKDCFKIIESENYE